METKLKKILKKERITQIMLVNKIEQISQNSLSAPIPASTMSLIVNGERPNTQVITWTKIKNALKEITGNTYTYDDIIDENLINMKDQLLIEKAKNKLLNKVE